MAAILKNKMAVKRKKKNFLLISTISMGQHNNYYAKVCFLPFQSQDPSPPLSQKVYIKIGTIKQTIRNPSKPELIKYSTTCLLINYL